MLIKLTIEEIQRGIQDKKFSYLELMQEYQKNFEKFKKLNVAISTYWDRALAKAKQLDESNSKKALSGIPIGIKDMFLTKNDLTTAASKVLENFVAPYESFVTSKLLENEYIMPFKTNLDEFAMGSSNLTSAFGKVVNPWIVSDRALRVPGGSSGGSAAAVAAHMCVAALGTDTGGSIRQPAALCGIVGFKPTYGRLSRRGVIAFGSSLDHPAIFARNVQDCCYVFEGMSGHDKYDSTNLDVPAPALTKIKADVANKKIGVVFSAFENLDEEYKAHALKAIKELENQGAIIKDIKISSLDLSLKLYLILAPAEAASNLARYDGLRYGHKEGNTFEEILANSRHLFGDEVKRRILIGNFVLGLGEYDRFFGRALRLREQLKKEMHKLFSDLDGIILPTTVGGAFGVAEERCPMDMYHEDTFTVLANMYSGPAISVPIGKIKNIKEQSKDDEGFEFLKTQEGLPVGIQVLGAIEREDNVISIAKKIEEIIDWKGIEL